MRHEPSSGFEDESLNYRVTWEAGGETHEEIFTNRDQGWDRYQQMQRDASNATWEHIPA